MSLSGFITRFFGNNEIKKILQFRGRLRQPQSNASLVFRQVPINFITTKNMPSNIEIKAKMTIELELASAIALELSKSQNLSTLLQEDVFFNCPNGRLKLRREVQDGNETAVLIAYDRPDIVGPKLSDFVKTPVPNADEMEEALRRALGVKEKVIKKRLFTIAERDGLRSRIHLDNVEGLGNYIEFEVMIDNENSVAKGEEVAKFLSDAFHIKDQDLIDGAYVDIIIENLAKGNN